MFSARGDASLKIHLESSSIIKYTSPISQNAIIDYKIVDRVNEAKCFTVLVDETSDIAGIEQVSICVRYIDLKCLELHEEFLQFVPTTDASGKGLSNLILDNLKKFGINTQYLRGQVYDGAAAMAGKYNGVQAYVKKEHPLALYVHCSAHSLNLAVSVSCNVSQIRNCMGTIGKLRDFFMFPKRKSILSKAIEISENNISKKSLERNCETRWIERYHSVSDFLELFECVEEALEEICEWDNTDTPNQAGAFRISILQPEFIITMVTISKIFGLGLPLSKQFQKVDIDLKLAMDLVQDTLIELEDYRKHAQKNFEDIFLAAKKIADNFNVTITIPRINKRQKRLNGLAMLNIHRGVEITVDEVIAELAK
ncbi:zinc finger MYM-type protein 1-like [Aphis gossypii]|uniref:zinc finger MYM-type protein 1-like n=1 Tax=Aphis gossypii TaxID=80765 RepID=UPI0021593DD1|nr:zinc finger MYM-type protein 1-like [Aphis gossypii]